MFCYLQLELINQDGCFDILKGDVEENLTILGGVAIGIGCVQVCSDDFRKPFVLSPNVPIIP